MVYRFLGKNGPLVSVLGYGGWALGEEGWPDVDRMEALRSLETAFSCGITLYDTAPFYGKGLSEEHIGTVLSSVRHQIVIATKCGIHWDSSRIWLSLRRDDILREVEQSLRRLKTDYIDLYQVHWYDHKTPLREIFTTLKELKQQNIIRFIGVCNFSPDFILKARRWAPLTSVQAEYNLANTSARETLFPLCKTHDIGFLAYSPLGQGFFAGKPFDPFTKKKDVRKHNPLYAQAAPQPALREAFSFVLSHPSVTALLVSMTKSTHVKENVLLVEEILAKQTIPEDS